MSAMADPDIDSDAISKMTNTRQNLESYSYGQEQKGIDTD